MKYLIDEMELRDLVNSYPYPAMDRNEMVSNFLANKKPVEEIASGKVDTISCWECDYGFQVGSETTHDLFQKYNGKSIKIYIEVKE